MSPRENWQREIREGIRRESWSISGPRCIVKVLPFGSPASALGGYITTGASLVGKSPRDIERALGLPKRYLDRGARIYRFVRLPLASEYEYELTAAHPAGLAFSPAHSHPDYPPGSSAIHQWRIRDGIRIPVDAQNFLELAPGMRVPYDWIA